MTENLTETAFRTLQADQALTISFFATVSRFEYASKEACPDRYIEGKNFLFAWDNLGNDLRSDHEAYQQGPAKKAIEDLTSNPPRVFTRTAGWKSRSLRRGTEVAKALDAVRRVRNNLFHGNKGARRDRNDLLLNASLRFIAAVLEERRDIRDIYFREI